MAQRDDLAGLVAHGGWELDDVQARHRANPDTFWLPPDDELDQLVPGTNARLIFRLLDQADPVRDGLDPYAPTGAPNLVGAHERMWLWVEQVSDDGLVGVLKNLPVATHTRLVPGARVRFQRHDVIDLDLAVDSSMADELAAMAEIGFPVLDEEVVTAPEDPERRPSIAPSQAEVCQRAGVRPERPWAFSRCLVGRSVADGVWPIYGMRWVPDPDKGDCGWSLWAVNENMEEAAETDGFDVISVQDVQSHGSDAWRFLALPLGWGFVLGPDGYEDVFEDSSALEP